MPLARFLLLSALLFSTYGLFGAGISGTVKDSTGAVIAHARIEIRGGALDGPVVVESDGAGHFSSSDLKPGSYTVRITAPGFETQERTVEVSANAQTADFQLAIAAVKEEVTVAGTSARFANADSVYQQLRRVELG